MDKLLTSQNSLKPWFLALPWWSLSSGAFSLARYYPLLIFFLVLWVLNVRFSIQAGNSDNFKMGSNCTEIYLESLPKTGNC